jgi:hypothetical protein
MSITSAAFDDVYVQQGAVQGNPRVVHERIQLAADSEGLIDDAVAGLSYLSSICLQL